MSIRGFVANENFEMFRGVTDLEENYGYLKVFFYINNPIC